MTFSVIGYYVCCFVVCKVLYALLGSKMEFHPHSFPFSVYKAVYAIMYGEGGAGQTLLGAILCVGAIALAIFLMDTMLDMEKRASNYIRSKKTKNGSR